MIAQRVDFSKMKCVFKWFPILQVPTCNADVDLLSRWPDVRPPGGVKTQTDSKSWREVLSANAERLRIDIIAY
jgi:hypothetical protein